MADKNQAGNETLQIVLDNMQSLVYVCDVDTYEIIFANKALKSFYNFDITGHKCWKALSTFDSPCPYCKLGEMLKRPVGEPMIWENYNKDMDMWLQMNDSIVKWPDGRMAHLITITDISGVKKSEEALKQYKVELEKMLDEKTESEQILKSLSDNQPDSFVFQLREPADGGMPILIHISKGVETICKMKVEEIGNDLSRLLNRFDPEDVSRILSLAAEGKAFKTEARCIIPDTGEVVWLLVSETARKNKDGETIWDGLVVNISVRKKTEEELHRSQEELLHNAALMKEVSDNMVNSAMYRTHLDEKTGKIVLDYASKQLGKIAGVPVEELMADISGFVRNIHPDDVATVVPRITSTTASVTWEVTDFRYIRDGETFWYRLQSKGFESDGCIIRDGMVVDITAQKILELQLIAARNKAEESDKLKSTFMANMSHEIRTPMNAIIGFLEFLTEEDDIPRETQKEYMRIVSDNATQLLKLIGDILDISKIDAGQMKIIPEETNVNVLMQDIRASFEASGSITESKNLKLIVDTEGQDTSGTFTVDSVRLRQILNNIIGNAIKFTDNGHVKFGYRVKNNTLNFFVEDTGIGISKEKLADIGKPFHQLHDNSKASKYGGTGIGLAISFNLVRLMKGTVDVESEIGKGTTFNFSIPCKELEGTPKLERTPIVQNYQMEQSESGEDVYAFNDLTGHTILIAEDVDSSMSFLKTLLSQSNATIIEVNNGLDAVEMVCRYPEIELVLMDVRMPNMDGLEATMNIKEVRPELPVVGQTAFMTHEDQQSMTAAGFDDYLAKPVKRHLLQEKINKFIKVISVLE